MGSEQAAVLLAATRHPSRWQTKLMMPGERKIWDGLGNRFNAEAIQYLLFTLREQSEGDARNHLLLMWERFVDFDYAMQDLRIALHAGELTAEICDADGRMIPILQEGWGGPHGLDILLRGLVDLEDTPPGAVVLVRRADIAQFATDQHERDLQAYALAKAEGKRNSPSSQAPRQPLISAERIFAEWREQQRALGRVPTYEEDVAYMKEFGIGRDRVRKLRKSFPRLPRGKSSQRST